MFKFVNNCIDRLDARGLIPLALALVVVSATSLLWDVAWTYDSYVAKSELHNAVTRETGRMEAKYAGVEESVVRCRATLERLHNSMIDRAVIGERQSETILEHAEKGHSGQVLTAVKAHMLDDQDTYQEVKDKVELMEGYLKALSSSRPLITEVR